jgi:hypothetical protein
VFLTENVKMGKDWSGKDALSEMRADPASVTETNISVLQLKIKPGGSHGNISHSLIFEQS